MKSTYKAKSYICIAPDGTKHEIRNLKDFCFSLSLNYKGMLSVANGRLNHYKNWKCFHLGDYLLEKEQEQ